LNWAFIQEPVAASWKPWFVNMRERSFRKGKSGAIPKVPAR
jgi:hypothetical protein